MSYQVDFGSGAFITLCKTHKVKELYAFGSVVNGGFNNQSDVDLLVEIDDDDPINRVELLLSFYDKLEKHFNRKVDLLTNSSLRNRFLKESIGNTKKLVYGQFNAEISEKALRPLILKNKKVVFNFKYLNTNMPSCAL